MSLHSPAPVSAMTGYIEFSQLDEGFFQDGEALGWCRTIGQLVWHDPRRGFRLNVGGLRQYVTIAIPYSPNEGKFINQNTY